MVKKNPPDDRVVYLALKNVFKGHEAEVRNTKPIKKLIRKHQAQDSIASLVREHNIDVLCNCVQNLLSHSIFSSTLKAKIRFPELFDPSPVQSAEREASEAEAARHDAETLQQAVQGHLDGMATEIPEFLFTGQFESSKGKEPIPAPLKDQPDSKSFASVSQLFPVYFPFKIQHDLLTHLQRVLEKACYDYGVRTMPNVLHERRWDCAEAVELNRWADEFRKRKTMFAKPGQTSMSVEKVLGSVTGIRHTAVHRLPVSSRAIEQFLLQAEAFTMLLGNDKFIQEVSKLRRDVQTSLEELERNKHFLQSRLDETLQSIEDQRIALQLMEDEAIANMLREDREYQAIAGRMVEESMTVDEKSEHSFSTAVDTEREGKADPQASREVDDSEDNVGSDTDEAADEDWRLESSSQNPEQEKPE